MASYDTIRHSDSIIITQIYNIIGLRPIMGTRLAKPLVKPLAKPLAKASNDSFSYIVQYSHYLHSVLYNHIQANYLVHLFH